MFTWFLSSSVIFSWLLSYEEHLPILLGMIVSTSDPLCCLEAKLSLLEMNTRPKLIGSLLLKALIPFGFDEPIFTFGLQRETFTAFWSSRSRARFGTVLPSIISLRRGKYKRLWGLFAFYSALPSDISSFQLTKNLVPHARLHCQRFMKSSSAGSADRS